MSRKVSVITITKNDSDRIEKTILSVINQTYENIEYILVDGNSNDGTETIIDQYRDKIATVITEPDDGIYNAQNKGIKNSTGDYLIFINAGDHFTDENVVAKFMSLPTEADIIYGDLIIVDTQPEHKTTYGHSPSKIDLPFLAYSTLWHPVSFIKSNLFNKYGLYDESFKIVADYEFFLNVILKKKCSTFHLDSPVTNFYTDGIGSSESHEKIHLEERKRAQLRHFTQLEIDLALEVQQLREENRRQGEGQSENPEAKSHFLSKPIARLRAFLLPHG